jgi:hypothetical protein
LRIPGLSVKWVAKEVGCGIIEPMKSSSMQTRGSPAMAGISHHSNSNLVRGLICRLVIVLELSIVLTNLATGCQTLGQVSLPSSSPQPTPLASPTPGFIPHDFGSLAVSTWRGAIWLLVGGERPRLLAQGEFARLSPDGCWVVSTQRAPYCTDYWLISVDDSTPVRLFPDRAGEDPNCVAWVPYGMAWSPDSEGMAVTTGSTIKRHWTGDLLWVDVSDGTRTVLAARGAGYPHFSPNGRWVATTTPEEGWTHGSLGLLNVDKRVAQQLFADFLQQHVEWAEDSSGFAVALRRWEHVTDGTLELWWVPIDGAPVQTGQLADARSMAWQPGAERLVYSSSREDPERPDLHLANRDGSGDVVVPDSAGKGFWHKSSVGDLFISSSWSPDGRWLLTTSQENVYYIVDIESLDTHPLLEVDRVHGWLDSAHYLASTSQLGTELYCCVPLGACHHLARISGGLRGLSYTDKVCSH